MRVTVQFIKALQKKLGINSFEIDVSSYRDIVSACQTLIPSTLQFVNKSSCISLVCNGKTISPSELDFKVSDSKVYIVPSISGGSLTSFDSLGNLNIFYGASKAYSNEEVGLSGINRRIIDSSLFGQAQTAFDVAQRRTLRQDGTLEGSEDPTTGFGSLNITSAYGQPIPLNFGLVRVGGSVINSYIKHIQRGTVDSVRVTDYV